MEHAPTETLNLLPTWTSRSDAADAVAPTDAVAPADTGDPADKLSSTVTSTEGTADRVSKAADWTSTALAAHVIQRWFLRRRAKKRFWLMCGWWVLPLLLPLLFCGAIEVVVGSYRYTGSVTVVKPGEEDVPTKTTMVERLVPALVGCFVLQAPAADPSTQRRVYSDALGVWDDRIAVSPASNCSFIAAESDEARREMLRTFPIMGGKGDAAGNATGGEDAHEYVRVDLFDIQHDMDGQYFQHHCVQLHPTPDRMSRFFQWLPFVHPCVAPWALGPLQRATFSDAAEGVVLVAGAMQSHGFLNEDRSGLSLTTVSLLLLVALSVFDLLAVVWRHVQGRGDLAHSVRRTVYQLEEEEAEESGVLDGARGAYTAMTCVCLPILLVSSLAIFPFFPCTIGLRASLSLLLTDHPGPARLRAARAQLRSVWLVAALVVGPTILFVYAPSHPLLVRSTSWYAVAWLTQCTHSPLYPCAHLSRWRAHCVWYRYAVAWLLAGSSAMGAALCIGAPEAARAQPKPAPATDRDVEEEVPAQGQGESPHTTAALGRFYRAQCQLLLLTTGLTARPDVRGTCSALGGALSLCRPRAAGQQLYACLGWLPAFWSLATAVVGAHSYLLLTHGPALLTAFRQSGVAAQGARAHSRRTARAQRERTHRFFACPPTRGATGG